MRECSSPGFTSLRVITEKLRSIEEQLAAQNRAGPAMVYGPVAAAGFDHDVKIPTHESTTGEYGDPISMVTHAIKGLDNLMNHSGSPFSNHSSSDSSPHAQITNPASYEPDVPDAVSRGFVTVEEAQQLFDL